MVSSLATPLADRRSENCCWFRKSRRTPSCRSFRQSRRMAPSMWPPSYALVSSSTSTKTVLGALRFCSAQSAETRTSERAMVFLSMCSYLCRVDRAVVLDVKLSGRGPEACDEWIDLAAETEPECGVEERREQGECGGHGADEAGAGEEADGADGGEDEADELREPQRCGGFAFAHRSESRRDEAAEDPA